MILGGVSFCAVLGAARLSHLGLHLLDDRVILKLELLALTAFCSRCKEIKHCQVGLQCQEAVVAFLAESPAKQLRDLAKAGACGHIQQAAGQSILDVDISDLVMEQFPALRGVLLTLNKVGKIERRLEVGAGQPVEQQFAAGTGRCPSRFHGAGQCHAFPRSG